MDKNKKLHDGFRNVVQDGSQRFVLEGIDDGRRKAVEFVPLDELRFSYTNHGVTNTLKFVLTHAPDRATAEVCNQMLVGFVAGMDPRFRELAASAVEQWNLPFGPNRNNIAARLAMLLRPESPQVIGTGACFVFWCMSGGTADPDGWVGELCRWG